MATPPALPACPEPRRRVDRAELAQARELTVSLVRRDLKVRHRGTLLGMLWSLTNPLLVVGLYYVVFKFILGAAPVTDQPRPDGHDVPFVVYFFCGLTIWNLFNNSVVEASGSVVGSGYLLRKVYFPRAILPLSNVLSNLVAFGFALIVLSAVTLVAVGIPNLYVAWLPAIVAVTLVLSYGFALLVSAVTVFFRDVAHFIGLLMQLWFWGTPILYSLQYVESRSSIVRLLELNPMTGVVVGFRNVVLLGRGPSLGLLVYDAALAVVVLAGGALVFRRWQRLFPEIV